jgi:hypothetical protein
VVMIVSIEVSWGLKSVRRSMRGSGASLFGIVVTRIKKTTYSNRFCISSAEKGTS